MSLLGFSSSFSRRKAPYAMWFLDILLLILSFSDNASAADAAAWRSRSIYQVFTDRFARPDGSTTAACSTSDRLYCGGTWQGLIKQLDYIQGMGFTAVWISPVTKQIPQDTGYGDAYHGYWQQDLYSLNSHFGSAADLNDLSSALHSRGMYLMVDVVVNHNGYNGDGLSTDYSVYNPFNKEEYYHSYCEILNYSNQTNVEDCWLGDTTVALPDLRTEDPAVSQEYYSWINGLVSNYSIDGLRIDTVKHVDMDFWAGFNAAAGVYCTGEVLDTDASYVCPYQENLDSLLNYPVYFPLISAFESTTGSMSALVSELNSVKSSCKDTTLLGSFSENADQPRFASLTSDLSLAQNVLAYTLLADGVPIVYYGQEQRFNGASDPTNREALWLGEGGFDTSSPLYKLVAQLNQIRNQAIFDNDDYLTYNNWAIYSDTSTIAMRKGATGYQIITVLSNLGANGASYSLSLPSTDTGFTANEALVEVLSCSQVTADGSGNLAVAMGQGLPKVFYTTANLKGSGVCGM